MSLKLLEAPLTEPVSLPELKAFLKITTNDEDDLLFRLIQTARQGVEAYTARALIRQSWVFKVNAGFCVAQGDSAYIAGHHTLGQRGIDLPRAPFLGLIKNPYLLIGDGQKEINDYRLDTSGRLARIHFGTSVAGLFQDRGTVCVEFSAGYGNDKDDVPENVRHAVLMVAGELYENPLGANDNGVIPPCLSDGATTLLKPYRFFRL